MKKRVLEKLALLPYLLFALFILLNLWLNRSFIPRILTAPVPGGEEMDAFEGALQDEIEGKYTYIELNGLMARALDMHSLNRTIRFRNNSIDMNHYLINPLTCVEPLSQLSELMAQDGRDFLYVSISAKEGYYDTAFPPGYTSNLRSSYLNLCRVLDEQGVNHLDMDAWFVQNGWTVEDTYFRTDHHWRPEAAFEAFREIMKRFSEDGAARLEPWTLDPENWETESSPNAFLGYAGRRTGIAYAGLDDFTFVRPRFDMDVTAYRINPGEDRSAELDSRRSIYHPTEVRLPESLKDYHSISPFASHIGRDYPIAYFRNTKAVNQKKIMVVGDSFRLPVEAFLSTQFSELYHIDLRHYLDGTFMEAVEELDPDIVLALFFAQTSDDVYEFGIEEWKNNFSGKSPSHRIIPPFNELFMPEAESENDLYLLAGSLEPGAYELDLDDVETVRNYAVNDADTSGMVQAALIDVQTGEIEKCRYFISGYGEPQKWLFTVPENPDANYSVVFYNGMRGNTRGNTTRISQVTLGKMEES